MKSYLQLNKVYRLKDGRFGKVIAMDTINNRYMMEIDNKQIYIKEDDIELDVRNYIVEYISKESGYSTNVNTVTWTKSEIDLYWEDEVKYWLDDEANTGDRLILRDEETREIIREDYKII